MSRANTAIIRERYPVPTMQEILVELNGSSVFFLNWISNRILVSVNWILLLGTSLLLSHMSVCSE